MFETTRDDFRTLNRDRRGGLMIVHQCAQWRYGVRQAVARKFFSSRAFPEKIDHILSWPGMQRIRIG